MASTILTRLIDPNRFFTSGRRPPGQKSLMGQSRQVCVTITPALIRDGSVSEKVLPATVLEPMDLLNLQIFLGLPVLHVTKSQTQLSN